MVSLEGCKNIFIDFDGVIVNSNKFKELAIEESIFQLFGKNETNVNAINYFNKNAGISRKIKLSLFFEEKKVSQIMDMYSKKCIDFFYDAYPTKGLHEFLKKISKKYLEIKFFILSGGEKNEIQLFLEKHALLQFFEDILASDNSKIDHLKNRKISKNDIFIGDSINDLKASLESGVRFILFEGYKSQKSFPSNELIKEGIFLKTKNFESLIRTIYT